MRRKDREIVDINEKIGIVEKCKVCRLALADGDQPYIVPLNYGYTFAGNTLTLYFHSAREGRKMDIVKVNSKACFEIDAEGGLVEAEAACGYGYAYQSVTGFGEIVILESAEEKIAGLNELMKHQTGKNGAFVFEKEHLEKTVVYKMNVREFTGKMRAAPEKQDAAV